MARYGSGSVPIATGWKCTNGRRTHRSSIPRSASGNTRARPALTTDTSRPPRNWSAPCPGSSERCNTILSQSDPICFLFADPYVPLIMRGCIAADFEEQRTEVFVINVEVVMVDVNRLITVDLKPPVHLFPVERLGLLLRHPNEDNAVAHLSLTAEVVGDVVLPFLVMELVDRYSLALRLRLHRFTESLRYPSEDHRRWNRHPQLEAHEHRQPWPGCQLADVAV